MATKHRAVSNEKRIVVTVYPIAGRQWFFRVPETFCRECDLAIRAVKRAIEELGSPPQIEVRIRPWLSYLPQALSHGGWHPPVVTISGKRFSQGVVPDGPALREELRKQLAQKEVSR